MKARKRRHRVEVAERVKPTDETAAKLTPDPLWELDLDADQEHAANEIYRVYKTVYGKTMVHLSSLERFERGVMAIADGIAMAHNVRFIPWARENPAASVRGTLQIVVERQKPNIDDGIIRTALTDYARRFKVS